MFTLAICTILNGYTQVNIKILLIQSYNTTCVSFSCEFIYMFVVADRLPPLGKRELIFLLSFTCDGVFSARGSSTSLCLG